MYSMGKGLLQGEIKQAVAQKAQRLPDRPFAGIAGGRGRGGNILICDFFCEHLIKFSSPEPCGVTRTSNIFRSSTELHSTHLVISGRVRYLCRLLSRRIAFRGVHTHPCRVHSLVKLAKANYVPFSCKTVIPDIIRNKVLT